MERKKRTTRTMLLALCFLSVLCASCYNKKYSEGRHYDINYNFVVKSDSIELLRQQPEELASDLLGNIKINLVLAADPLHMLAVGDTISGATETGLMTKVGEMMPAVEKILPKLDSIATSLNILLSDPALRNTLHSVEGMTANPAPPSRELRGLSASLNREVPAMMGKANGVLDNTQQLTANLAQIDVAQMTASVNQTLANVEQMTQKLNSSEGTLGLLMRDASLYNNLSNAAADADALLVDLKERPWRYVHFSLIGGKK